MEVNKFADVTEEEFFSEYTGGLNIPARLQSKPKVYKNETSADKEHRLTAKKSDLPKSLNWFKQGAVTKP